MEQLSSVASHVLTNESKNTLLVMLEAMLFLWMNFWLWTLIYCAYKDWRCPCSHRFQRIKQMEYPKTKSNSQNIGHPTENGKIQICYSSKSKKRLLPHPGGWSNTKSMYYHPTLGASTATNDAPWVLPHPQISSEKLWIIFLAIWNMYWYVLMMFSFFAMIKIPSKITLKR